MENGKINGVLRTEQVPKRRFCAINSKILPYKLHFFLFCGAMSSVLPYRTVYTVEILGLSGTNLATLLVIQHVIIIASKPIIGAVVDYFNSLKAVTIALTFGAIFFFLCLLWVPLLNNSTMELTNSSKIHLNITKGSSEPSVDNLVLPNKISSSSHIYWVFCVCYMCGLICSNALFTLSDTACYENLKKTTDYGRQRVWGAIGWGLLAPFAGFLNDTSTGILGHNDYSPGFYLMAVLCVLLMLNISRLNLTKPVLPENILKCMKTAFSTNEFLVFEYGVFMTGVFTGLVWHYLMVYLKSIGASALLLGLVHTCQCFLGEVPFLFVSGFIVERIGHVNVLAITMLTFFVRFMCYSYLVNPWYVLPVEICHGLNYAVFYATITAYGKLSAYPGAEAVTQSIITVTYEGIGLAVGCLIGGFGFDILGGRQTFFVASFASLIATIFYIIACLYLRTRRKSHKIGQRNISTISSIS